MGVNEVSLLKMVSVVFEYSKIPISTYYNDIRLFFGLPLKFIPVANVKSRTARNTQLELIPANKPCHWY